MSAVAAGVVMMSLRRRVCDRGLARGLSASPFPLPGTPARAEDLADGRGFFAERPEGDTRLVSSMDALSEVLRVVKLDAAIFFNAEFSEPWCLSSPEASTLAPILVRAPAHIIIFHLL